MKPAPFVLVPHRTQTDLLQARQALGHEPKHPVGVVLSPQGFAELVRYGCRFPCRVAVDPTAPRETVAWFYLEASFQPFVHLLRA